MFLSRPLIYFQLRYVPASSSSPSATRSLLPHFPSCLISWHHPPQNNFPISLIFPSLYLRTNYLTPGIFGIHRHGATNPTEQIVFNGNILLVFFDVLQTTAFNETLSHDSFNNMHFFPWLVGEGFPEALQKQSLVTLKTDRCPKGKCNGALSKEDHPSFCHMGTE